MIFGSIKANIIISSRKRVINWETMDNNLLLTSSTSVLQLGLQRFGMFTQCGRNNEFKANSGIEFKWNGLKQCK